jgi:hypothetical protein
VPPVREPATKELNMEHAIKIIVRGFHTRKAGNRIIDALAELGLDTKECFDDREDDLGGIVETYITEVDTLDIKDPDDIRKAVYRCCPGALDVYVEARLYKLFKAGIAT